jgi:hypothetical protein
MRHTAYKKLVSLIVLPAFVLAHLFCICQAAAAPASGVSPAVEPAPHACHAAKPASDDGEATHKTPASHDDHNETPDHSPHNSDCSHCGEGGEASVVSQRTTVPDGPSPPLPFTLPLPLSMLLPSLDAVTRLRPHARFLSDSSPPIEPLRMKCALVI